MSIRWRPMQPRDVRTCVDIIASHPVIGPRYGAASNDLSRAWLRILGHDAAITAVFEEVTEQHLSIWGVGVSVVIHESFLREMKQQPLSWFGPELARRLAREDGPLLSNSEFREVNSSGGLTAVTWEGTIRAGLERRSELFHHLMNAFLQAHRGYLWKEFVAHQAESADRMRWTLDSGGRLWDPESGRYTEVPSKSLHEIVLQPHIMGVTRDMHREKPSPWVAALFEYSPPQIGFSRSEQQLLIAALRGEASTDDGLAAQLRVSLPTIKKMWLSIYRRTGSSLPDLVSEDSQHPTVGAKRGKGKRGRVLPYLRQHPEELRPHTRRQSPGGNNDQGARPEQRN